MVRVVEVAVITQNRTTLGADSYNSSTTTHLHANIEFVYVVIN